MQDKMKVLFLDAHTGYYRMRRYGVGDYFGPVDLGLHLSDNYNSLNIGTGLFAGSILPGSNRLIFTGFSPCWRGFYISSMGGAGLVFDNLGLNMVSLVHRAPTPSVLYLNRMHGDEIEVELVPVDIHRVWSSGRGGIYGLMDWVFERFGARYADDPRILATGPASWFSDCGAIGSVPMVKGKLSHVDTWAGRGGLGSRMVQEHGIVAIIYGGTVVDEDFRDRKVADDWFENKYEKKLAAKDFEATTKYRFDPTLNTGGTFGVNYAHMSGRIMAFNYRTNTWTEEARRDLHQRFVLDHYLKQFNEETISNKQQFTCGEPCSAVCKKMNQHFKKDYEPYQTMGPLCGVFDQRGAEMLNRHCDTLGFDAISIGGVVAWMMDLLDLGMMTPEELGVTEKPRWDFATFDVEKDSMHNATLGVALLDSIVNRRGLIDLSEGVRKWARRMHALKDVKILDRMVLISFGRKGWMVPNQYWTPGVLAPMAIMGKYYMVYGFDFLPPRELGRACANRLKKELTIDNLGICRFHRGWAEDMGPQVMEHLYQARDAFLKKISVTASRINSRNASVYWESARDGEYVLSYMKRRLEVDKDPHPELPLWVARFEENPDEAGVEYWFEVLKGIHESLRDFQ
ncbi:aldehyde ferredoxin oxidoreductase [Myxococcota bacterium]|nr:aldehyde ferredoxin oxidoreductase [Myxococcota bacterium]